MGAQDFAAGPFHDHFDEVILYTQRFWPVFITLMVSLMAVIWTIGFAPFAMRDYFTIRIMGTLLPFALTVALLADLLLVPALVKLGAIRFKLQDQSNLIRSSN